MTYIVSSPTFSSNLESTKDAFDDALGMGKYVMWVNVIGR